MAQFPQGAVIDEIQRVPDLTSEIQVLVDEDSFKGLWVLTGSQNFSVKEALSQTMAGRIANMELLPFSFSELQTYSNLNDLEKLMFTVFYPRVWHRDLEPTQAYRNYVTTYLERDLRQLGLLKI